MGLIQHHTLQDYWATDEVLSTPFFATVMKRNRFLLLLSFLHFNNNEHYVKRGQDGYDPLYKHVPKEVKCAKPLKGETFVTSHGDMNIIKYHDKRYVTMCTTLHNDIIVETNNVDHSTGDKKKTSAASVYH